MSKDIVCWWGDKVTQPWHSPKAASKCHKLLAKSRFRISKSRSQRGSPAQSQLALLLTKLVTPAERNPVLSSSKDPKYVNVPFIHCSNLISTNINSIPKIWKILKIQAKAKHIYSNDQSSTKQWILYLSIVSPLQFFRAMGDSKSIFL